MIRLVLILYFIYIVSYFLRICFLNVTRLDSGLVMFISIITLFLVYITPAKISTKENNDPEL